MYIQYKPVWIFWKRFFQWMFPFFFFFFFFGFFSSSRVCCVCLELCRFSRFSPNLVTLLSRLQCFQKYGLNFGKPRYLFTLFSRTLSACQPICIHQSFALSKSRSKIKWRTQWNLISQSAQQTWQIIIYEMKLNWKCCS